MKEKMEIMNMALIWRAFKEIRTCNRVQVIMKIIVVINMIIWEQGMKMSTASKLHFHNRSKKECRFFFNMLENNFNAFTFVDVVTEITLTAVWNPLFHLSTRFSPPPSFSYSKFSNSQSINCNTKKQKM